MKRLQARTQINGPNIAKSPGMVWDEPDDSFADALLAGKYAINIELPTEEVDEDHVDGVAIEDEGGNGEGPAGEGDESQGNGEGPGTEDGEGGNEDPAGEDAEEAVNKPPPPPATAKRKRTRARKLKP